MPAVATRLGSFAQAYTLYNSVRPFGVTSIVGGVDEDGAHLYMIEPSGTCWGYLGAATGKGRQTAKSELEKLDLGNLTIEEGVRQAAKIIYMAHEDTKDKEFELEVSWVSESATGGLHQLVPEDVLEEAKQFAIRETSSGNSEDQMEE